MKKTAALIAGTFLFLAACGNEDEASSDVVSVEDVNLDTLEVELDVPDHADPGEEVTFSAYVTQGDEEVDDASEVKFEIWTKDDKENSEMVEADLPGSEGVYTITYTVTEEDVYFVQPHTTARGQHVMPVKYFAVGEAELPDDVETEEWEEGDMSDHHHGDGHDGNNENNHNH